MVIFAIDIILIICSVIILRNFYLGGIIYVVSSLVLPQFVAFVLGPINLNMNDMFLLCMLASFIIHRKELSSDFSWGQIFNLQSVYIITSLLVLLFSSYVPAEVQNYQFAKNVLFHTVVPVFFCFYLFQNKNNNIKFLSWVVNVGIIIGIYGIICYIIKENPYIKMLNLLYYNDYSFEYFLTEARGGLSGRVSGTVNHPLSWGQLWGILLALFVMMQKQIGRIRFRLLIVLACLNILFSGSRSALVSLAPILVCYGLSGGGLKIIKKIALYAMIGFALSFTLSSKMQTYLQSAIFFWDESRSDAANINGSNVDMRIRQIETTMFDVQRENIFVGYGLGYLEYASMKNVRNSDMLGFESVFFQKMYEQGLVGLFGFFCFMLQFYLFGAKRLIKSDRILFFGYCASYLLSILFTGIQNTFSWYLYFGLFLISYNKVLIKAKL